MGTNRRHTIGKGTEHNSSCIQLEVTTGHHVALGGLNGSLANVFPPKTIRNAQFVSDVCSNEGYPSEKRMCAKEGTRKANPFQSAK